MLKNLLLGVLAPLTLMSPAIAEVQPGTRSLLERVSHQYTIEINPKQCDIRPMDGSFRISTRTLTVCSDTTYFDANDHDTVRHEVWHIIQHCLRHPADRTLQPVVATNNLKWQHLVGRHLTHNQIDFIQRHYPEHQWEVEYEAVAMAKHLTSSQIQRIYQTACE